MREPNFRPLPFSPATKLNPPIAGYDGTRGYDWVLGELKVFAPRPRRAPLGKITMI